MPRPDRTARRDSLVLASVALLVRVPAFWSFKQLGFDDGQFAVSVLAMRHGGIPYRDVFSSQGPLFLPFAYVFDLLTFRTIDSPRAVAVVAGVVLTVAVYAAGRTIGTRRGALLAAGLVTASGSVLWTTGPLTSDGPTLALAACTVAVALAYRAAPSTAKAVAIGLLGGSAFAIKSLFAIPVLVVAALVLLAARRRRHVAMFAGCAAALVVAVSVPWGLSRVIDQSVRYHTDKAGERTPAANATKTSSTLGDRDLPLLVTAALVAAGTATAVLRVRRRAADESGGARSGPIARVLDGLTRDARPVVVWLVLVAVVLLVEHPMWRNHVAHLVPAVALLVGLRPPAGRVLAAALLLTLPYHVVHLRELLWPHHYTGRAAAVVRRLHALPRGALAISDDPGLVWRAGLRPPDRFVDVSILRITSPRRSLRITEDDVVEAARRPDVCAVVVWSAVRFGSFPDLAPRLAAAGYAPIERAPGSPRVLYVKSDCRVPRGGPTGRRRAAAPLRRSRG